MAGAVKASISLSGQPLHDINIPAQGQKASASVVQLKGEVMTFLNDYMARNQLNTEEVDLMEEIVSDDDEDKPKPAKSKKGAKRKANNR